MRAFIVLCLVAVACADKLGYNYKPVAHSENGLSFAPGAISDGVPFAVSAPEAVAYSAPAELEKEFYTFSANEAEFEDASAAQRIAGAVKQGLRVIFIKSPENKGFEEAALALAKQASQQKTAIYVLNRQTDIADLANKFNSASRNVNSKPEVHFIKYRTPEDANNAKKVIQSQYDSLGGKSQNVDGGVAPVINFASAPINPSSSAVQQPQSAYLPSSLFRRRI